MREAVQAGGHFGIIRADGLLETLQRARVCLLRFVILLLVGKAQREEAQAKGRFGMLRSQFFLIGRYQALVDLLGLRVLALALIDICDED